MVSLWTVCCLLFLTGFGRWIPELGLLGPVSGLEVLNVLHSDLAGRLLVFEQTLTVLSLATSLKAEGFCGF